MKCNMKGNGNMKDSGHMTCTYTVPHTAISCSSKVIRDHLAFLTKVVAGSGLSWSKTKAVVLMSFEHMHKCHETHLS